MTTENPKSHRIAIQNNFINHVLTLVFFTIIFFYACICENLATILYIKIARWKRLLNQ